MFIYNLAFLKRKEQILMLNRNKSPWMGRWNGVGGKINSNETLNASMIREIYEETGLKINEKDLINKGYVTWNTNINTISGLHLFLVNLADDLEYETPISTHEGILDFKDIKWISDLNNKGICDNIPYFINDVINSDNRYNHKCTFDKDILISVTKEKL